MWAGQVVVDVNSTGRRCAVAVDSTPLVSGQPSSQRFLIALPPLSRVTSVAAAFGGKTGAAALRCSSDIGPSRGVSRTACFYRERDSGGLTFVECWAGAEESGCDRPIRFEVEYEPLPQAARAPRESMLGGCVVTDSSARIFSNPADAQAWYSPPDTNLSSLFGGDPLPYNFEFAELTDVPLKSQVVILVHVGGWGNVRIENADDIRPTIGGVKEYLNSRGISSVLVPYYRARGGLLGKLVTLSELFELHHSDADRLCHEVQRFLRRHPQQRLIMVGLSNGAAFADEVMERLPDTIQNRVCAIEVGPPFLSPSDAGESVLRIDNHGEDPVATGDYWVLLRVRIEGLVRGVSAGLTGRESPKAGAFVAKHEYSWPNARTEVTGFLDRWLDR
jgi:hypothetical protein